jgi:hypothetical protein
MIAQKESNINGTTDEYSSYPLLAICCIGAPSESLLNVIAQYFEFVFSFPTAYIINKR